MNSLWTKMCMGIWLASCKKSWLQFELAASQLKATQERKLQQYLRNNAHTGFGVEYGFETISSVSQFQERVPPSTFDDYSAAIDSIAAGEKNILTRDDVLLFEPSSGSAGSTKLIPYTSTLREEFHRGINGWLWNVYSHYPAVKGRAYFSISPASSYTPPHDCRIPVGFEDDTDYLGAVGKVVGGAIQAVPPLVTKISDIAVFRYVTLLSLLSQRALRLISVWNPTFLTLLMDAMVENWGSLLRDIRYGTVSPPGVVDGALGKKIRSYQKPNPKRAAELETTGPYPQDIWSSLRLISCWSDGPSRMHADHLRDTYFQNVTIQGKGLIATEAFVSFPLVGREGAVLSGHTHFFEFIPLLDETTPDPNRILLAHQLEIGQTYSVVVSTGGGLYRYQLQDTVKVVGYYKDLPCISFMGKLDNISDIYGEKLHEQHIARVLAEVFQQYGLVPEFYLLCPGKDMKNYMVYLEDQAVTKDMTQRLGEDIDTRLRENFHYDYCRKLGQLKGVLVCLTSPGAAEKFLTNQTALGKQLGNIKSSVLHKHPIDEQVFR
ncbi:MAG: GH3 auxin-responsive promoter family protein [Desulfobulbaceae bacterium]|nr:GH3 auxin-responsive promoter family protein [Desulfobulbaceae bacterium]